MEYEATLQENDRKILVQEDKIAVQIKKYKTAEDKLLYASDEINRLEKVISDDKIKIRSLQTHIKELEQRSTNFKSKSQLTQHEIVALTTEIQQLNSDQEHQIQALQKKSRENADLLQQINKANIKYK